MSKMSELHYKLSQREQEDDPSIEYLMKYPYKSIYTITYQNWYNKHCVKKDKK